MPCDPMVSVIIPVLNDAERLRACLEALGRQTYPSDKYELIVVIDGSTDDSEGVAASLNARVITQEKRGPAVARNHGVQVATGDLVLFTDADCVPDEHWIREMTAPFSDAEVSGARGLYKTHQRGFVARFAQIEYEEKYEKLKRDGRIDFIDTSAAAYRISVFRDAGGFQSSFKAASGEDTDLSFRLAEQGHKLVLCPRAFVYHSHPERLWDYLGRKFKTAFWRPTIYQHHPGKVIRDSHTPQMFKLQILALYLVALSFILCAFSSVGRIVFAVGVAGFLLGSAPFLTFCLRRDAGLVFVAPIYVLLRTAVFCIGLPSGVLQLMVSRKVAGREGI